jgi:hypothetical protein
MEANHTGGLLASWPASVSLDAARLTTMVVDNVSDNHWQEGSSGYSRVVIRRAPLDVRRGTAGRAGWEGPHDGIPVWLRPSLAGWLSDCFWTGTYRGQPAYKDDLIRRMERVLGLPLTTLPGATLFGSMVKKLESGYAGLNIIDWVLGNVANRAQAKALDAMLAEAGSTYTVGLDSDGVSELQDRLDPTLTEVVRTAAEPGSNAEHHLARAWSYLYGRHPDPSASYWEAVKAVEAAARPVVSPKDNKASLGKMIPSIVDRRDKWQVVFQLDDPGTGVDGIVAMMRLLWKGEIDRHGTDKGESPPTISAPEADSALHLAATLVRMFTVGAIALPT